MIEIFGDFTQRGQEILIIINNKKVYISFEEALKLSHKIFETVKEEKKKQKQYRLHKERNTLVEDIIELEIIEDGFEKEK